MAARWGRGEALSMLGLMALRGFGEPRDPGKAVDLCRQAAVRGYAKAETGLGCFYWEGELLPEDRVARRAGGAGVADEGRRTGAPRGKEETCGSRWMSGCQFPPDSAASGSEARSRSMRSGRSRFIVA